MAQAASPKLASEISTNHGLRKELGLRDLVLAQVLCVVGSAWVGVAAKLGAAHVVFWLAAMALFYLPLACLVIYLNREMPLEGGLYQWSKFAFGEFFGFLTAWNLWVYAAIVIADILFVVPTDLSYLLGHGAEWIPSSRPTTFAIIAVITVAIAVVSIRGLGVGKWLHNAGGVAVLFAYLLVCSLPAIMFFTGRSLHYTAFPWQLPTANWLSLAIFGQMTIGALSGFEYIAIMAGESRNASRTVGQSVVVSAPVISLMFILGTSSVLAFIGNQPINLIGPIPQTLRLAFGNTGAGSSVASLAIALMICRAIASASLIFTGLTRLPMAAGWDHLLPNWFTVLHPRAKTPVNSILFVAVLVLILLVLSMAGVHEQEAMQLLQNASSVHYGISYIALFAIPLFGAIELRRTLPAWLKLVAAAGLASSLIAVVIAVHPIIDVESSAAYGFKIAGAVIISNIIGVIIYRRGQRIKRDDLR